MERNKLIRVLKSKKIAILVVSVAMSISFSFTKVHAASIAGRYNGVDRYETAAKVCEDGWSGDTDYAIIVNGENFPDALSAAPLAKKYDAPILLTRENVLNPYTSVEINRLNVKNVFLIGGKAVISQSIEDALKARGIKVTRLGGQTRYDTGIEVAKKLGKTTQIAVVNGTDFYDGMSIASIAAYKGMPIILTGKDSMPDSVKKYLQANKNAEQIYVVGDLNRINDSVFNLIPNGKRIGTGDIYERNVGVINAFQNEISTGTVYVASAKDFPDSLVASAVAPLTGSPLLYVNDPMPKATEDFLKNKIVNNVKVLGGYGVVGYDTESILEGIPLNIDSIDNLTDTIWQDQKYTPRPTMIVTATDGTTKEVPVKWNVSKVNTSKPGIYTINGTVQGTNTTVVTTLVVKPVPVKIDDLNVTSTNGDDYSLPETVSALMSDGTTSQVSVTWDYGSQQNTKTGVYVFSGTVERYSKKVKLTLTPTIAAEIKSIPDIKLKMTKLTYFKSSPYYKKVSAKMTNGTIKTVSVDWDLDSLTSYPGYSGVYTYTGTVDDYSGTVKVLIVTSGAKDPTPNIAYSPDSPYEDTDSYALDPIDVMEGEPYNLPTKVADPITGKMLAVTWTTTSIDTEEIDEDSVEDSRVSAIKFKGTLSGSTNTLSVTVNVRPKIMGIDSNSLDVTIDRDYYETYELPNILKAVMSDGSTKDVSVISWDTPYITIGDTDVYTVRGKVNFYDTEVTLKITVED